MKPELEFIGHIRRPFVVQAVQITEENIDEVAALVGNVVERDGKKYISLDRRLVPNIRKAYIGWWITKLDDNIRCYSPKVFEAEFMQYTEEWDAWLKPEEAASES